VKRDATLQQLRSGAPLDVLVVGGGITGAGVALEAARSGANVALVEARDFASGTSSRSSKLVHGGLRYLAQGQFGLTRESLRERDALRRDAPGLVQPLRFLMPVRRGDRHGRRRLGLGLALYDRMARTRTRHWHDAANLLEQAPPLDPAGLTGGWSYQDAQTDDARLVLRVLAEARRLGALTLNHIAVESLSRGSSGVDGATLRDAVNGERIAVQARCVVNATGVWADALRGELGHAPKMRPLRGSHLLLADWRLPLAQAVAFFHPADGRPVFALPWEGCTLVGTTDLDHREDLNREPAISRSEFDYLLVALQQQFPSLGLAATDVVSTWSGVRPTVASAPAGSAAAGAPTTAPSKEARDHFIVDEDGLITVTGGKLTTFRASALAALKLAAARAPALRGLRADAALFAAPDAATMHAASGLPTALRMHLLERHGDDLVGLLDAAGEGELTRIARTATTWAELRWACRAEAVVHLDDLLLRRSRLGLLMPDGASALLPELEPIVQQELAWSEARWDEEQSRYRELVRRCHGVPPEVAR